MRELDQLLVGYLEDCYATDDEADKAAFRELLGLADPELNARGMGVSFLAQKRQSPSSESIRRVIDRILRRAEA